MTKFATALIALAMAVAASATPINAIEARDAEISPTVLVCTGGIPVGCVTIPVVANTCVNFNGGLTFLNKEVSAVQVPNGYVCTFFDNFGCLAPQGGGDIVLQGGVTNLSAASGTAATVNFNDIPSSFSCSPVF
ncbi:hypothetical protein GALMADRAFT_283461 [Galerina marginata CBS 339.88]|uniref:Hydrophobin n=1 Tax=Galerina marginata (strain CBS 339.88) TaxID=685588 RepID=A0A067SJ28_GALM3|nr:hypothetical protein GALMADRAFT_283461 [Galerina marginata CBS 339.88]